MNVRSLRVLTDLAKDRIEELEKGEAGYREEAPGNRISDLLVRELDALRAWVASTDQLITILCEEV